MCLSRVTPNTRTESDADIEECVHQELVLSVEDCANVPVRHLLY